MKTLDVKVVRNPKTGRIIKNPERYIARLQAECDEAWAAQRRESYRYTKREGEQIINWQPHEETKRIINGTDLIDYKPGDIIATLGRVVSSTASRCQDGNAESSVTFTVIETRRLPKEHWSWLVKNN